jgi:flagellar hook protein FlgE
MGLSSAVYTGLSGLNANQSRIDTIGNNIANVNTTAFKGSRTLFQTQFYETLSAGASPSDTTGGVNPMQYGRGVVVATTQQNFNSGAVQTTGLPSDLALEGEGFFIVETADAEQRFTRDGAFALNAENDLISVDGNYLLGYGADAEGNIDETTLSRINIPLGTQSIARSTTEVSVRGDLSALSEVSLLSSESVSQALVDGGANEATDTTLLTDLRSASDPATALLIDGDSITVQGVSKGDRELPDATFVVGTDGTTLGDFANWLEIQLGIQEIDDAPGAAGVTVENGSLVVRSNAGEQNSLTLEAIDFVSSNPTLPQPLSFTQLTDATGGSTLTGFTVYDSLGTPVNVQVTFALEEKNTDGVVWRYFVESPDTGDGTRAIGGGLISFDNEGNVRTVDGNQITLDRTNSGALTPLTFTLDFDGIHGLSTNASGVILDAQNGFPPGDLTGYGVDLDGTLEGTYSNGLTRTLGRIPVAMVPNMDGMIAEADNLFAIGPNAGALNIATPGEFGSGTIRGGALELSNVELGEEFIGLVTASTGFQASSRVISVSTDMLNQLLLIVR